MRARRLACTMVAAAGLWLLTDAVVPGQELEHGMTPADLERGAQIFLASCAVCHGPDGDLIPTVDLGSGTFRRATTDQDVIAIIRRGVPGTPMPPNALSEADAARVVAYLRGLPAMRRTSGALSARGNAERGKALYQGKGQCRDCHSVGGDGGFLGPDLSSIGVSRRPAELYQSLVAPDADIRNGNRTVKIVRRDGSTVVGRLLNQDTYTLQLIDARGGLLSLEKRALRQWEFESASAMSSYKDAMTGAEIVDLVSYLATLQAPPSATAPTGRAGGRGAAAPAGAPGQGQRSGR